MNASRVSHHSIRDRLVQRGNQLFDGPRRPVEFTGHASANNLINDLENYPHAFVVGCVMDRQIKAERAWIVPQKLREKLSGDFSMKRLSALSLDEVTELMSQPEPLHRYLSMMSRCLYSAIQRIADQYDGDASRLWNDKPASAEVVSRFLAFDGVGPKIACMAVAILARQFKVSFADYYSADIAVDVHVRRVFARLGLTPTDAKTEQIIFKARALYPQFPGLIDFPTWEIGRTWCHERKKPDCAACYMRPDCSFDASS